MTLVPTLIELAFLGYAQSGMPGLGAVDFLISLLKSHATTPVNQSENAEKTTTATTATTTIEPSQTQSSEEFRNPVSVNNDNVEKADVNIEINHHQHHHYHDDQEAISDGGRKPDDENTR